MGGSAGVNVSENVERLQVRPAEAGDLDELLAVLDRSFSWPRPPCLDFRRMLPHLLHPGRVGDHLVGLDHGRIVAVVGVYPSDLAIDGVLVRGAAIGQVATLPEFRGRGHMQTLLAAATNRMARQGLELAWLTGDRRRYGVHGWALGGCSVQYTIDAKSLPTPPDPTTVERMALDELVATLVGHSETLRCGPRWTDHELALLARAHGYGGVRRAAAWVIHAGRGDQVAFAEGDLDELGRIFAHLITRTPVRPGQAPQLIIECADAPSSLSRAGMAFHCSVLRRPSCLWRIGELFGLLGKAAAMAAPRIGPGADSLALINTDTGEAATLECRAGRILVHSGADALATTLATTTRGLSELCFGQGPIEHSLPTLAPDSPIRQVLPIRAHFGGLFRF